MEPTGGTEYDIFDDLYSWSDHLLPIEMCPREPLCVPDDLIETHDSWLATYFEWGTLITEDIDLGDDGVIPIDTSPDTFDFNDEPLSTTALG